MRIDYVIDSYSQKYPVERNAHNTKQPSETNNERTSGYQKVTQKEKTSGIHKGESKVNNTQRSEIVSEDAQKVLSADEKQMLTQLFPPGLFGAGIRSYNYYASSSEEVKTLGNKIDVRQ